MVVKQEIVFVKIGAILAGKALPLISCGNSETGVVKAAMKVTVLPNISGFAIGEEVS